MIYIRPEEFQALAERGPGNPREPFNICMGFDVIMERQTFSTDPK
jgi:hypothetical protein